MDGGAGPFQLSPIQDAAFGVHLGKRQTARLRDEQGMPKHEKQKASVVSLAPRPFGGRQKLFHFKGGKVLSLVHHFVSCPLAALVCFQSIASTA